MVEFFEDYFSRLTKFKVLPLFPLEINFLINLAWVVVKSIIRISSGYKLAKNVIFFLFSFLATLAINSSLNFWFSVLQLAKGKFIWWLPSAISVSLAELSGIFAGLESSREEEKQFFEEEGKLDLNREIAALDQKTLEDQTKKTNRLSYYFVLVFLFLLGFWSIMVVKHFLLE